ncbi:hypothetical protein [Achromobacter pestifer]
MINITDHAISHAELRARIAALIDEFFGRVDRGESVADLVEEGVIFKTPQRFAEGRDALSRLLLDLHEVRKEKGRVARHFGGNITVDPEGPNVYRVRSLVVVLALDNGTAGVLNMGDHDDLVHVSADGTCRFLKRSMVPVMELSLGAQGGSR